MKTSAFVEGIQILSKYTKDEYSLAAEHDIIYFTENNPEMPKSEAERLEKLGWFIDEESGSWAAFT